MSDRTSTESGEPQDLLSYISSQQMQAVPADEAVNPESNAAPVQASSDDAVTNVGQVASDEQQQQAETKPLSVTQDDEKTQLQAQVQAAAAREQKMLAALTALAVESKKREAALFEKSLEYLTPEEQELERERQRVARIESENQYLQAQRTAAMRQQEAAQEQIDKTAVAYRVVERLGLPATDPVVMQALMESESFPEMVAKAQRIATVHQRTEQLQSQAQAAAAQASGVHVAGGETAPATTGPKTSQRSGDLIGMMREREYTYASSG